MNLGGTAYTNDDIIAYNFAAGTFSLMLAGSSWLGASQSLVDVDGFAMLPGSQTYFVSLDTSANVGSAGVADDEDVILFTSGSPSSILDLSAAGFPGTGSDVDALDVQTAPFLQAPSIDYQIVNTATAVTYDIVYVDSDEDAPGTGNPTVTIDSGSAQAMTASSGCGVYCNGFFSDGEQYVFTGTVPYGASHTYAFSATDGIDATATTSQSGPSYVSDPGDADGDMDRDAVDLAIILIENNDTNGGASLDLVRNGTYTTSWGGTDADSDHLVGTADLPAAVGVIY